MNLGQVLSRLKNIPISTYIAIIIIEIGLIFRLSQYLANRSLWMDEALLVSNIIKRSFIQLSQPLDFSQSAPLVFLYIQRILFNFLGNNEFIFRLFPFISGVIALIAFYKTSKSILNSIGTFASLSLFAISDKLIYYASEIKQYSSDTMIVIILLFIGYKHIKNQNNLTNKHYIILFISGIIGMWSSHPALFMIFGLGTTLACSQLIYKANQKSIIKLGIVFFGWLINFVLVYKISLQSSASNKALNNYWQGAFMPHNPSQAISWISQNFLLIFENPIGLIGEWPIKLGIFLAIVGIISFSFREWRYALLIFLPILATLAASAMQLYPFNGRLLLFIIPLILLCIGEGVDRIYSFIQSKNRLFAITLSSILVSVLIYSPTVLAVNNVSSPEMKEHIRPFIQYTQEHKDKSDLFYIYYGSAPAFLYYTSLYNINESNYYIGVAARQNPEKYLEDINNQAQKFSHIWFLFSHNCSWCIVNEQTYFLQHLDSIGIRILQINSEDAALYLYSFEQK